MMEDGSACNPMYLGIKQEQILFSNIVTEKTTIVWQKQLAKIV